jgi:hypothetical protein
MTTVTKGAPRSEKQAARSIQRRFSELGMPIPLSHAYEALAAASGHRNWQTMRAAFNPSGKTYVLGRRSSILETVDAGAELTLPYERCLDHFEFLGKRGAPKTLGMLRLAENAIRSGAGLLLAIASRPKETCAEIARLVALHGRTNDLTVVSVADDAFGRYAPLFEVELGEEIVGVIGKEWSEEQAALGRSLVRSAVAALRMRGGQREEVTPALLRENLSIETVIDLADPACQMAMPYSARSGVRRYLKSIPGYGEDRHYRQSLSVRSIHLSIADPICKALASWRRPDGTGTSEVVLDRVVGGSAIAVIVLPPPSDTDHLLECRGTQVLGDLARACAASPAARTGHAPALAVFDHFDRYWGGDVATLMKGASRANVSVVLEAEEAFNIPALKKATTFLDDTWARTRKVLTPDWEAFVDE